MPWESWHVIKPAEEALILWPNWLGVLFLLGYFGLGMVIPALLAKDFYKKLGMTRYLVTMIFILSMFFTVVKIIFRLAFSLKYFVQTPWFAV